MLKRQITRDAEKAIDKMRDKHFCQVYDAIEALRVEPEPEASKELVSNVTPKRRRKTVMPSWEDVLLGVRPTDRK